MSNKAAKEAELQNLHAELAKVLKTAINETELKIVDLPDAESETGTVKTVVKTRNAAVLNAARQFLKDNNIQCARGAPSPEITDLAQAYNLPFAGSDQPGVQ